jgi:hypothetical protein
LGLRLSYCFLPTVQTVHCYFDPPIRKSHLKNFFPSTQEEMAQQMPRLASNLLLRSSYSQHRGIQQLAVLREEGELIGYWTRPDGPAATVAPLTNHKCRVVAERFQLPLLPPTRRWEEGEAARIRDGGHSQSSVGGGILVPKS